MAFLVKSENRFVEFKGFTYPTLCRADGEDHLACCRIMTYKQVFLVCTGKIVLILE